jgi:hypothetical protein
MTTAAHGPVHYEAIDLPVPALCGALNAFPGVRTTGSCGGHANPQPYQEPEGAFPITFRVTPDTSGWAALEFLAYIINNDRGGRGALLYPYSPPPYLNTPGACLRFVLEGTTEPDELATYISERRQADFIAPAKGR